METGWNPNSEKTGKWQKISNFVPSAEQNASFATLFFEMSTRMKIAIINRSDNPLPRYATPQSAGMDLCAYLPQPIQLEPGARCLIPTGLHIELPAGYEAQIRPRSGWALKSGVTTLNSPGTIDADYRGEIGVILINLGQEPVQISSGDRIAQMVIARYETADWHEVDTLSESERGEGGFGHTGMQTTK